MKLLFGRGGVHKTRILVNVLNGRSLNMHSLAKSERESCWEGVTLRWSVGFWRGHRPPPPSCFASSEHILRSDLGGGREGLQSD